MTKRRDVLKALAMAPFAVALPWTRQEIDLAAARVDAMIAADFKFFTPDELKTVRVLVDDIFPKDELSGSATDAKVPEFMDFILMDGGDNARTSMRTGLKWLDDESRKRFTKPYGEATDLDRRKILDDIAWPAKAKPEFRANVTWFNSFRNLTASGFFSSRVGYKALSFTGGVPKMKWEGSSAEIMAQLKLSYDDWDKKYGRGF